MHRRIVFASQFQRAIESVKVVPLLDSVPQRHNLATGEQHITPFDVHAVDAVPLVDCLQHFGDFLLPVVIGFIDALDRYAEA